MKIKSLIILGSVPVLLASCLKSEDQFGWDEDKGNVLTGIYDKSEFGESKPFVLNLAPPTETVTFLTIKTQSPRSNKSAGDIQATLVIDNGLVSAYNTAHGTNYLPLPLNAYSIPSLNVTVPKDGQEFEIPITINKSVLNLANQYGLGVRLTSVSEGLINEFENEIVATFLVKNQYDGIYSYVSGNVTRYTSPGVPEDPSSANYGLNGSLGPELPDVRFVTTGAYTLQVQGIQWHGGGGVGGVDPITITIDPATNLVTAASGANASFANWAGKENKYDPATKTFTLNWRWNPTGATREYSVVFKYKGPR
jgi:hypothetical protein